MKKLFFTTAVFCATVITAFAQVGIGTPTPNTSSVLDLSSTTKAFLPPRMTTAQRDQIASPIAGMTIFNITTDCIEIYRSAGWFNLCSGGGGNPLGPTSDSVAKTNLIAYWPFDTDSKEVKSNSTVSSSSGATFSSAGKIGNCATLTNGYLVYNPITNISLDTALQSYSISMWVNIAPGTGAEGLRSLFQVNGTRFPDLWGLVSLEIANNGFAGDSLALQARQIQVDGNDPYVHHETSTLNPRTPAEYFSGTTNWCLLTITYDGNGANQTLKIYANGNLRKTQTLTTVTKPETFRVVPTGGTPTPTPANRVTIGTFAFSDHGFTAGDGYGNFAPTAASRPWAQNGITCKIDDVRLFNKPLTQTEITNLYNYGLAGK